MALDLKALARPHLIRSAIAGFAALVGLVFASRFKDAWKDSAPSIHDVLLTMGLVLLVGGGAIAIRSLTRAAGAATEEHLGRSRSAPVRFLIRLVGYLILVFLVLGALDVPLDGLLLGGAVTGVALGIAAQQTLGNFFAGIVLLMVRPFGVGEHALIKGSLGEYEGTVSDISAFYVTLETARGRVALPNAAALASAVGPGVRSEAKDSQDDEDRDEPGPEEGGQAR